MRPTPLRRSHVRHPARPPVRRPPGRLARRQPVRGRPVLPSGADDDHRGRLPGRRRRLPRPRPAGCRRPRQGQAEPVPVRRRVAVLPDVVPGRDPPRLAARPGYSAARGQPEREPGRLAGVVGRPCPGPSADRLGGTRQGPVLRGRGGIPGQGVRRHGTQLEVEQPTLAGSRRGRGRRGRETRPGVPQPEEGRRPLRATEPRPPGGRKLSIVDALQRREPDRAKIGRRPPGRRDGLLRGRRGRPCGGEFES